MAGLILRCSMKEDEIYEAISEKSYADGLLYSQIVQLCLHSFYEYPILIDLWRPIEQSEEKTTQRKNKVKMRRSFVLLFGIYLVATFTSARSTTYLKGRKMLHEAVKASQSNVNSMTDYTGTFDDSYHEEEQIKRRSITVRPLYISRRSTSTIHPSGDTLRKVGHRPSTTTASPSIHWATDNADTCGGNINVPLTSDRISLFESSQFMEGRDYPLLCTWNIKASKSCSLARMTMRLDGRSRLPDVKGCTNGYYAVYPFMKQVKICGRIGDIPPLQWYVDIQQPENVTIVMENIGMNDGNPEGISFTLQGECIDNESDEDVINVDKENGRLKRRWMKRLVEDFERGEGPRVVQLANPKRRQTALPLTKSITTTEVTTTGHSITSTTTEPSVTTTKRRTISYDDHSGIPWLILKSPESSVSSLEISSIRNSRASTTNGYPSGSLSSTTIDPVVISKNNPQLPLVIPELPPTGDGKISSSSFVVYPKQSKPVANSIRLADSSLPGNKYSNIPWLILTSPDAIVSMSTSLAYSPITYTAIYRNPAEYEITPPTTTHVPLSTPPSVHLFTTTDSTAVALTATESPATATPTDVGTTLPSTYAYTPQSTPSSHQTSVHPPLHTQSPIDVIHPVTGAPTEASTDDDPSANDASLSYISLNGQKFIFDKLQRTFQRTFSSLKKLVSN